MYSITKVKPICEIISNHFNISLFLCCDFVSKPGPICSVRAYLSSVWLAARVRFRVTWSCEYRPGLVRCCGCLVRSIVYLSRSHICTRVCARLCMVPRISALCRVFSCFFFGFFVKAAWQSGDLGVFYILPVRKRAGVHLKMVQCWIWFPLSRGWFGRKIEKSFEKSLTKLKSVLH